MVNNRRDHILNSLQSQVNATCRFASGQKVKNINESCLHYQSEGIVVDTKSLPNDIGYVVSYKAINAGKNWEMGDILQKTEDQLELSEQSNSEEQVQDIEEYKKDFLQMNTGSLNAIMKNAQDILASLENENVKNNLTESWLQGKIAITEDYMTTIHDFVKYVPSEDDKEDMAPASLWENIRKKKMREGKKYKPAKYGDKDRPDKDAWKKAQK